MSHVIWLDTEAGHRALALAKTKYERDVIIGVVPIKGPVGGRAVGRFGPAHEQSKINLLGFLKIANIPHSLLWRFASDYDVTSTYAQRPSKFTRWTPMVQGGIAIRPTTKLVIGEVRRSFTDDAQQNGLILAASLVEMSTSDGMCNETLRDLFDSCADVEELFARVDGKPREQRCACGPSRIPAVHHMEGNHIASSYTVHVCARCSLPCDAPIEQPQALDGAP